MFVYVREARVCFRGPPVLFTLNFTFCLINMFLRETSGNFPLELSSYDHQAGTSDRKQVFCGSRDEPVSCYQQL